MFTQFFGSYLLNNKIVTTEQLTKALEMKNETRVKLGVLAINAGYLTSDQVEMLHSNQAKVDMRIGDLAVEMGLLTPDKVEKLLNSQKKGCLVLGQALVDGGALTNAQLEKALADYKAENGLSENDMSDDSAENAGDLIRSFYGVGMHHPYAGYIDVVFKSVVRFIGDDFTPLENYQPHDKDTAITQRITGDYKLLTAISGNDESIAGFAARYSEDNITSNDDYAKDCVSEFLNLANGLFNINVSDNEDKDLGLKPQLIGTYAELKANSGEKTVNIPLTFPFGTIVFSVTEKDYDD